jgi:ATP-dependent Lon protease
MEIPLFPLPLVLFPQVVVPLHIFEERYRSMINHCIEESSTFGIVLIPPGTSTESEWTIRRVGVTARVIQFDRIEDGRINIMAAGETRFRIIEFTASKPNWAARVEFFEDDRESDEELQNPYDHVVHIYREVHRLAAQLRRLDFDVQEVKIPPSPATLTNMVSFVLDIDPESKQALLEMTSIEGRLKTLTVYLEQAMQRLNAEIARERISDKVKGNGHRGKPENN